MAHFDADQQAVWDTLQALNAAWTRGDAESLTETLAEYFHPTMVAVTASDRLRRLGRDACIAGWQDFARATRIVDWQEIDPLVQLYGDAAVVSYYYRLVIANASGQQVLAGRDLFFFVREQGRWWAVADQFSAYPGDAG